jgi:hypothetical protein
VFISKIYGLDGGLYRLQTVIALHHVMAEVIARGVKTRRSSSAPLEAVAIRVEIGMVSPYKVLSAAVGRKWPGCLWMLLQ